MDAVRRIADAVLYEGYILWPYRRSALKNQQRWTFGGVYPPAWSAEHGDDPAAMQTQCLLEADDSTRLDVAVRFLHVVRRQPLVRRDGEAVPIDELHHNGERYLAWEEATERTVPASGLSPADLGAERELEIAIPAGRRDEELGGGDRLRRSWRGVSGGVSIRSDPVEPDLHRITVRVENRSRLEERTRERALEQTFCSCHTVLTARGGGFVSMTDPPDRARRAAATCENLGTWPVLVGEQGDRGTMLSSPIILSDYPQVAPESPGDLFDAGEIDQLLVLNILSLTDEEKREMRDSDPRAREILDRTEALDEDELMRLHGAIRELSVRAR